MLHIPIEHADDVNKLFVIPRVVVSLAILSLLSASITQQYTEKRLPCDKTFNRKRLNLLNDSEENRLELSPWVFTHVFKKIETTMRWNCMSKALRFLWITAEHQDCPFFTVFLTIKTLSQNISITLLQISRKFHEHRGGYRRKKLPWTILEEQFPVPRNTAAIKIGNSVISLLWQLRCHCSLNHNKFSSALSDTTVVAIFPNLCLWRRSLYSNLGGIDPEKLKPP